MGLNGTDNGISVYAPTIGEVPIANTRSFKLKYFKTFNTELTSESGNELTVTRKGAAISGTGVVNGYIHIIDNSFKYPSSYLSFDGADVANQFYFYLPKGENTIYPTIDAFAANTQGNGTQKVKFYLKHKNSSNLSFKFIGFPTTANSRNCFIDGNTITLDATLNATMKNAAPGSAEAQSAGASLIQIHLPKLVLKNNSIDPVSGDSSLMVTFKDGGSVQTGTEWKLEAKKWTIDPSQGGLVSKVCVLHTGKLDVPFSFFNLRSDFAYLNQPNINDINLGGRKINFGQSQTVFGFNPATGSDKKGHWQLIIYPQSSGTPVGTVTNLSPNLSGLLELETVSLLSSGEDVFTIGPGAGGMMLYSMADFKPLLLYTIADGFELVGNTSLKIPRVAASLGAKLVFTSAGMHVKPLDLSFTGKGNIVFTPNTVEDKQWMQKWETKKLTAYGKMSEPGKLEPVDVVLTHQDLTSGPITDIKASDREPSQIVRIGSSTTRLETISCAMHADAKDWNNFTFEGDMAGFKGMAGKNHMKFTVYGEIKATDQDLKAVGLLENGNSSFSAECRYRMKTGECLAH